MEPWILRPVVETDGPSLAKLEAEHPDSGPVQITFHYQVDAWQAQRALRPGCQGVVAEVDGVVVAMLLSQPFPVHHGGKPVTLVLLYSLIVATPWRRRGLAKALYSDLSARWRAWTGDEVIFLAGVQEGNEGSVRAGRSWAKQVIGGRTRVVMGRTPRREPPVPSGLSVTDVVDGDWSAVVDLHRKLFSGYELTPDYDPEAWRIRYAARPFGQPLNRYLVARDLQGKLVAGLGLWFDSQVQEGRFGTLPLPLRLLNLVVGLIPADGVLRRLVVRDVWFDPDHPRGAEAARALWDQAGWVGRDQGTSRMLFLDGTGPLGRAFAKTGMVPGGGGWLLVSSEVPLDLNRPIALPM